jgi:hypothetical protein
VAGRLIISTYPEREKGEVLAAFEGWKREVTAAREREPSIGAGGVGPDPREALG